MHIVKLVLSNPPMDELREWEGMGGGRLTTWPPALAGPEEPGGSFAWRAVADCLGPDPMV